MHPFDLKQALLAKHAQHVVLIHFPIALFAAGVAFDALSRWRDDASFQRAAYYNFAVAAFFTLPVVASGLLAWQFQLEGQKLKGLLLLHLLFASASTLLLWLVWLLHFRAQRRPRQSRSLFLLAAELAGLAAIALTAHLGGFLSGVNGPG